MKTTFDKISEMLNDPFFGIQQLGKEAIRQRISRMDRYGEAPGNFHFINWEAEDERTLIEYSFQATVIGRLLLASTPRGLCFLSFACKSEDEIKGDFMSHFPKNAIVQRESDFHKLAVEYCNGNHSLDIPLHMRGTSFQISIWKQLARIPRGRRPTVHYTPMPVGAGYRLGRRSEPRQLHRSLSPHHEKRWECSGLSLENGY